MRHTTVASVVVMMSLIAGCTLSSNRPPPKGLDIVKLEASEAGCDCPGAVRYQVKNLDNYQKDLPIKRLERSLSSPEVDSSDEVMRLPAHGSVRLQCSVAKETNQACTRQVSYEVRGSHYPAPPADMAHDTVRRLVSDNLQSSSSISSDAQCLAECRRDGGTCRVIDARNTPDAGLGRELGNLLGNLPAKGDISVTKIMAMTRSGKNECNRTDGVLDENVAYNYGDECPVYGKLPGTLGTVDLAFGSSVMFTYETGANVGNFVLRFPKRLGTGRIHFSNTTLENAYGGHLSRLDHVDGLFIGQIDNGNGRRSCMAIRTH